MKLKIIPNFYNSMPGLILVPTRIYSIFREDKQENEHWRKLHLKTQTRQSPTFHMESVCLCEVSLGFFIPVNLCVSLVVCVFQGEESRRLGVGRWLQ